MGESKQNKERLKKIWGKGDLKRGKIRKTQKMCFLKWISYMRSPRGTYPSTKFVQWEPHHLDGSMVLVSSSQGYRRCSHSQHKCTNSKISLSHTWPEESQSDGLDPGWRSAPFHLPTLGRQGARTLASGRQLLLLPGRLEDNG